MLIVVLCMFLLACNNNGKIDKHAKVDSTIDLKPPLPPGYREHQEQAFCDSLKARTYATLSKGTIELVTNDFPNNNVDKEELFKRILMRRFKLELLPIYDSVRYPKCIMPVMDSALASRYGPNGKESIIKWMNHYVDSVFFINKTPKTSFLFPFHITILKIVN